VQDWTSCPGCGLQLPAEAVVRDHRVNASAECVRVYAEVAGFASQHLPLLRLHQLTVDTYGAQHGGGAAPPIRLAYSLVGLHLAFECGLAGDQVRAAHQRMGKPDSSWPGFPQPLDVGVVTVMTVAEEGLMVDSVAGHQAAVRRWAEVVWQAWRPERDQVVGLTRRLLPDLATSR
jgi:hypothetical protein